MKFLSQINVNTEYTLPMVDGTNGQVLSTDGNGVAYWGTISIGSLPLDGLSDVIITSPSSDQMLRYGLRQGDTVPVWHNFTPNFLTPSSSIDALNDVTITSAATGQVLQWSGSAWVNATVTSAGYVSKVQHEVKAGVAITKGQALYVTGADGTNMVVGKASNVSEAMSSKTIGLAAASAAVNGKFFVITEGLIDGLNTSSANAGDAVWLGVDGALIFGLTNKPVAPAHLVYLGVVTRVNQNNGEIFVSIQNGFELKELHDVLINGVTTGQLIRREADGLWKNWTPNFLTSLPAHNHNDIYYTEEDIDAFFGGDTAIGGYNQSNWDVAYNDKINSASFSTTTGVLTLTQQDTGTVTVDLDGRYLESEADTLQSVTSRGSSTNTDIRIKRPANKVDNASCTELPSRVEFNNAFVAGSTGYTVFTYPTSSVFRIYGDYDGNVGGVQPDLQLGLGYLTVKNSGATIGNVGIGTTAPAAPLDVNGNVYIRAAGALYTNTIAGYSTNVVSIGASTNFIVPSGNVGIRTTTPQKFLDVNGSGIVASFGGGLSPGSFAGIHFGYSESYVNNDNYKKSALVFERTDNHGQGGNASGKIHFLLNNIGSGSATSLAHSVMVIDTNSTATQGSARVGIGTTSPNATLDVNGAANATSFSSTALLIANADTSGSLQPDQGDPANKIYSFRWQGNEVGYIDTDNKITFSGFKTPAGTSSQFLKANGTVDSNTYITSTALNGYATESWVNTNYYNRDQIDDFFGGAEAISGYNKSNWDAAYNDKINSASFSTTTGVLTLTQQDTGTVTVDLDGRYLESLPAHNHDDRYYTETESDSRYINASGDTMSGSLSFDAAAVIKKKITGVGDNPVKTASGVLASRSDNGGGATYYIIETTVPQDDYQMGGFTIELFGRYGETNNKTKIDLGGYWNPEGNGGFAGFEAHGTNPEYKPTIQVARNNNSGNTAFIISGVSWSYPVIVARDLWLGYNSTDGGSYGEGWVIASANNLDSYSNRDTVVWRNGYSDSNPAGYITGYTETDTLSSVTGRGATTSTPITINGGGAQPLTLTTANGSPWHIALVRNDLGLTSRVFAYNIPYNGWYFEHNIIIAGNTNWHSGNLTNLNQLSNGPGYITSSGNTSGYSGSLLADDNRTISPSEIGANQLKFGFTSWGNNNTSPWADYLHLRSYGDGSGGSDNLVMFKKSGIGMRIWQQTFGSATAYSSYADVWTTGDFTSSNVSSWNTAYGWGDHASVGYATEEFVTGQGYLTSLPAHNHDDRYYTETESDARYPLSRGTLGTTTNVGDATGFGNNLASGTYTRNYVGHSGQVWMSHDTGGSTGNFALEVTYYGAMYVHTNVDSSSWVTKQIWTSDTFANNSSNWNTAFGWGNHAGANYIVRGSTQSPGSWPEATKFQSSGDIGTDTSSAHSLQIYSAEGNDAFMAFHISNDFAVFFGLDNTTNRLYTGGWSDGNNKYQLWDTRDFTSTNVSNWNTAYNDRISSATVTGTTTKTLTLTQGDGGTVTASWTDYDTDNDAQQLSYDPGANQLSISNGNSIILTGLATEEFVTGQGYITGSYLPLSGGTLSGAVVVNLGNVSSDTVAFKVGGPSNYDSLTIGMEDTPDYDAFIASYGNDIRFYSGKGLSSENHSFYWFTSKAGTAQHGVVAMQLDHNQNLTIGGTFTEQSSIRYKENVKSIPSVSQKVEKLDAVSYNKIGNKEEEIGLIAEDVAELFPEVVKYDNEGRPDGVNYSRLSVILLKAVQELTERVNKLENK
jgi:hypothetical protein